MSTEVKKHRQMPSLSAAVEWGLLGASPVSGLFSASREGEDTSVSFDIQVLAYESLSHSILLRSQIYIWRMLYAQ